MKLADKDAVAAARAAYDVLTANQKALITNLDKLTVAEAKIAELEAAKAYETLKSGVETKVAAYEALTNGNLITQELIDATKVAKAAVVLDGLTDADKATFQTRIGAADAKVAAAQAVLSDQGAAKLVQDAVAALPVPVTMENENAVIAARTSYDALTANQKALVTNIDKLTAAEGKIVELEAAKAYETLKSGVETKVAAYETLANGSLTTQELIDATKVAKAAVVLDGLTDADKATFQTRIGAADAKVAAAQTVLDDQAAAKLVQDAIVTLPVPVTLENKDAVAAARAAYDVLTANQKALITNLDKLTVAEAKIAELEAAKAYETLKSGVETKVAAYEALTNGSLTTQELIDATKVAKAAVVLDGLTDADKITFQTRIDAADVKVAAAQAVLSDQGAAKLVQDAVAALPVPVTLENKDAVAAARAAYDVLTANQKALITNLDKLTAAEGKIVELEAAKAYETLKSGVETKVAAYETLANGSLTTQELIDATKVAKAAVVLDGLTDADKATFQTRIDAADAKVAAAQANLIREFPNGLCSDNSITDFVNDSTYPWKYDGSIADKISFYPTNQGVSNSTSSITFTVTGKGILTFDYKLSAEDRWDYLKVYVNDILLKENKISTDWNSDSVTLPNETQIVKFEYKKDGSGNKGDDKVWIANLAFYSGEKNLTLTVDGADSGVINGFYGSINFSDGMKAVPIGTEVTLTATANTGATFYGWVNGNGKLMSTDTEYVFTMINEVTIKAIFATEGTYVARRNGIFYSEANGGLAAALNQAVSGDTVRLLKNYTLSETIMVPTGVTLMLPYNATAKTATVLGTSSTATGRVSWTNESKYLYLTLTIPEEITLNVNGSVIVGAVQHYPAQNYQGNTSGAYSQIICNGAINVNDKGELDLYGLLKGNGTVTAYNGATLYQPFMIADYAGGTNTSGMFDLNQTPFNRYTMVNIQTTLVMHYGSTMYGHASLYFWGSITTIDTVFVGNGGLIVLSEGATLTATYNADKYVIHDIAGNNINSDAGKTTINISGGATSGFMTFPLGINTSSVFFAIPYNYDIVLENGSYNFEYAYKLMPGASLWVKSDATLEVTSGFYVYDGLIQSDMSGKSYPTTAMLQYYGFSASGNFIVDGTFIVRSGKTFGGIIQTNGEGRIILEENANVVNETVTDGGKTGYDVNISNFSLPARGYNADTLVLTTMEAGHTYVGRATEGKWVLADYTATYAKNSNSVDCSVDIGVVNKTYHKWTTTTVAINQPMTGAWLQATDGETYIVSITVENGTVTGAGEYAVATEVTLTAIAAPDYKFVNWTKGEEVVSMDNPYTFTMGSEAIDLTAKFVKKEEAVTYTVNFDSQGGSVADTIIGIEKDVTVTLPVEPTKEGFTFGGWFSEVDGAGTEFAADTAVTANVTVYAKWTAIPATTYTLTLTGEGLTSNHVVGAIGEGTEVTVTVTPAVGQQVTTFTVCGIDKKADLVAGIYTFTITANTTVVVTYEAAPTDQQIVDEKIASVPYLYELPHNTTDTDAGKIEAFKDVVEELINDSDSTITVDVAADDANSGKFKVTLTKGDKTAAKGNITVTIVPDKASIASTTAAFVNNDDSAKITITSLVDVDGISTLLAFHSDDGTIFTYTLKDNATGNINVVVTKAEGSDDLMINTPSQATATGAYTLTITKNDGSDQRWTLAVIVS